MAVWGLVLMLLLVLSWFVEFFMVGGFASFWGGRKPKVNLTRRAFVASLLPRWVVSIFVAFLLVFSSGFLLGGVHVLSPGLALLVMVAGVAAPDFNGKRLRRVRLGADI